MDRLRFDLTLDHHFFFDDFHRNPGKRTRQLRTEARGKIAKGTATQNILSGYHSSKEQCLRWRSSD